MWLREIKRLFDINHAPVVRDENVYYRDRSGLLPRFPQKLASVILMGDHVIYLRTPRLLLSGTLSDEEIEDFREFASVSDELIQSAMQLLSDAPRYLRPSDLENLFLRAIALKEAQLLARLIDWLRSFQGDDIDFEVTIPRIIERLKGHQSTDAEAKPAFTATALEVIRVRIQEIASSWGCLDRQKKAETVAKATGQRLQSLQLVCDFRPIFDSERTEIDGFLPVTTMHIVFEGADGLPNGLDVILSEKDVERLAEHAEFAKSKLAALKSAANRLNTPIPSTDLTKPSIEEQ